MKKSHLKLVLSVLFLSMHFAASALATEAPTSPPNPTPAATENSAPLSLGKILKVNDDDEVIINIQLRLIDLNYFSFKHTGTFGSMTRASIIDFQEKNSLVADGRIGDESLNMLFSNKAVRNSIPASVKIPIGPTVKTMPTQLGVLEEWAIVNPLFQEGAKTQIIDLNTGSSYYVNRVGGQNHARVEPASSSDATTYLDTFGGTANWSKRPVIVVLENKQLAASISGDMRGSGTAGVCDLYFQGSTTDSSNLVDEEHRRTVLRASGINW